MENYSKNNDDVQIFFDFDDSSDDHDLIPIEPQITLSDVPISKKSFSNPTLTFDNADDEANFNGKDIITPDTLFSPKDKISNRTWDNKLPIGRHMVNGINLSNAVVKTDGIYVTGFSLKTSVGTNRMSIK